ncbi:MAG: DUF5045 domain-containing protein [Prevotella sp.]|nr:DUF5045 domain-containing protein [Prevotella sp.]MBQ6203993.1 DUF5045 domain-containing protein [Prevotella sp.]
MKRIGILFVACLLTAGVNAQVIQHDEQKEKQWRSMENGPWDFAPDWYYYLFHKDYSGAETYWAWRGFKSGLHVRFKESKSNVKRIMPTRVISEETQRQKEKKVEEEMALVKELHQEEVERAADRNVDLMYNMFKDDFNRMQERIAEGLLFVQQKTDGKMNYQVTELSRQNDIVCKNIEYIHRQGIGYELENAKRQKAYMEAKKEMEKLVSRVAHLVGMAQAYYQ